MTMDVLRCLKGYEILRLASVSTGLILIFFIGCADFSFASNLTGDTPSLSISLADNSIILVPTVSVSGTATDSLQISSTTWSIDNGYIHTIPGIIPGEKINWSFGIPHLSNGLHILQVNTTNSAGFVTSKKISFSLYNEFPVTTASLPNGTYKQYQTVRLETSDPALIFYTLDGTTPTLSSPHEKDYVILPEIKSDTILKFFAVDAYGAKSGVTTQIYMIDNGKSSIPVVSNPTNVISDTTKLLSTSKLENKTTYTTSEPLPTPSILQESSNTISSTGVLTNSQNMTTVNATSTLPVIVQSNSTEPIVSATQNMTTVNATSTLPVIVQSNSTSILPVNATK